MLALSSSNGFSQLINEPTHRQTNSTSCFDLIFTDKPGLSVDSGVHWSLHPKCHHQIIYSTFNLSICYPSPYQQLAWDYEKADPNKIRKVLDLVNWERLSEQKSIDAQFAKFNDTILNTFRNFIPNKYITINDKDNIDFILLENLITELDELISSTKSLYYKNLGKKLNNPLLQAKTYLSTLKPLW